MWDRFANLRNIMLLLILSVGFFFVYSFLASGNVAPVRFTWPDEMANHYFISSFVNNNSLVVPEALNTTANNFIVPRSVNLLNGNLVPGTFLGFILLLGLIVKVIGVNALLFVTPFFGALIPLIFYLILRRIFEQRLALLSTILLYCLAPFAYYANFIMLPSMAFLFFLLLGFYFLMLRPSWIFVVLGFLSIGISLAIRTNEAVWILLLILLLGLYYRRINWRSLLLAVVTLIVVFLPIFYYNNLTFGNPFNFGYLRSDTGALPTEFKVETSNKYLQYLQIAFMPFGWHPRAIWHNFFTYGLQLFWYLFIPAILGGFILLKQSLRDKNKRSYILTLVIVSGLLLLYYGSWVFADPLTVSLNMLGLSYVRYWLPIYILFLPLWVMLFLAIIDRWESFKLKALLSLIFIGGFVGLSIYQLYFFGNDNLRLIKKNIQDYHTIYNNVVAGVEDNAVIWSERSDKIFFPQKKVIFGHDNQEFVGIKNLLDKKIPVYYFGFTLSDREFADFNNKISDYKVKLTQDQMKIGERQSLYKFDIK